MKTIKTFSSIFVPMTILFVLAISAETNKAYALDYTAHNETFYSIGYKRVDREEALRKFFEKYNSPLIEHSETFVAVADKYEIDYRLLPAISCMESTCGKFLIEGSYNPFGWGVYGNQHIAFEDYDEAIEIVGAGLNKGYFSQGLDTVEEIAPVYTPPNSYNWARGVNFFTGQIAQAELTL